MSIPNRTEQPATGTRRTTLAADYAAANPRSRELFERQSAVVPDGITHTARAFKPFPLFISACRGARKWDVDGHEYVDYWMGHGSFLLGHSHPQINAAITAQLANGTHAGGETELAIEWAEAVCQLVPSIEAVRFTSSGGEATQLALRMARAYTGKRKIVRFRHHFHGWHDSVAIGLTPPWELPMSAGVSPGALQETLVLPANDIGAVRQLLAAEAGVAAVILEPGGGYSDTVPSDLDFLGELRLLTEDAGVVLIFDEVVTGFRYAPGGVQEWAGVLPDLTTLGKIVGGGLPAGAVGGRADLMELLGTTGDPDRDRREGIPHYGTWNAMPIAAAAGIAALRLVATGEPGRISHDRAEKLRQGLNAVFEALSLPAVAYGRSSIWKTYLGERVGILDDDFSNAAVESELLARGWGDLGDPLRQALLLEGIDPMRAAGFTSATHTEDDIARTVEAFGSAIRRLRDEGILRS